MTVRLWVSGIPVQQGSLIARLIWSGGKPRAVLHSHASAALKAWRKTVAEAVRSTGHPQIGPYVQVEATFHMPKPRTTKYPDYPAVTPDLDKLVRAVFDALTESGIVEDDARIVRAIVEEVWVEPDYSGPGLALIVSNR